MIFTTFSSNNEGNCGECGEMVGEEANDDGTFVLIVFCVIYNKIN